VGSGVVWAAGAVRVAEAAEAAAYYAAQKGVDVRKFAEQMYFETSEV